MKPFKDTKFFKFLSSKGLDTALDIGATVAPPLKVLDLAKDAIVNGTVLLSDADKKEFLTNYQDYLSELQMYYGEMANAREVYKSKSEMTDRVALLVMRYNLPLIGLCLIMLAAATYYLESVILSLLSATIGSVITMLSGERLSVINFYFGSSIGSKQNGEAMRNTLSDKINEISDGIKNK
ncbi:MAG TPA: hypothetical protein PLU58_01665 [Saprospiraceae bacterium]|jgi:hypothetical protein|nr:hypothetical protein [Saprospiraceae bacterium]